VSSRIPAIVDAHIHLWDLQALSYPWLTTNYDHGAPFAPYRAICQNYLISDLRTDTEGLKLSKAIHINAAVGLPDPVAETAWVQQQSDKEGFALGIIAGIDLASETRDAELERHSRYPGFRGVRMLSFGRDIYAESKVLAGLRRLEAVDLVCDVDVDLPRFHSVYRAALTHQSLRMVIGHSGLPTSRSREYFQSWSAALRMLASAENVVCKISGLGWYDHSWSTESIKPWVSACLEAFGVERCMFASDWPVDRLFSSYGDLFRAYDKIVETLGADERHQLFAGNAERYYRV
jgi:predicted TIM-barrel fold metal-dependent hydrolase